MAARRNLLDEAADNFKLITDGLAAAHCQDHPEWGWLPALLGSYFEKASQADHQAEPMAWVNFGIVSELFWAMDIVPVVVDVVAGYVAQTPKAVDYIDVAQQHVPDYICGNNKVLLGATLTEDIPLPQIMVHPSHPCDSNLATYPVIAEYYGFPYFCIDMPYSRSEHSVPYVARELGRLVALLETITGHRLDLDRLRQAMEYSNQAHDYILKLRDLRQAVPTPYSSLDAISEYGVVLTMAGTPQLVDYFKTRYAFTKEKVSRGEGHLTKDQEKVRLAWIYGSPVFDMAMYMWLERKYGAVSVANMNNNFVMRPVEDLSSIESILNGLAEKVVYLPMTRECGGPWENYLEAAIDLCQRYKADAAVFGGNTACKSNWAIAKLVKDRIRDELDIPTLNLEIDLFDPRYASSDSIKASFDEFFAMML
jgi:benzoyl-CoA reductase/2-hydroxyglutaryl-CoA dehydratase subunit BcrC/BadD/HgdB